MVYSSIGTVFVTYAVKCAYRLQYFAPSDIKAFYRILKQGPGPFSLRRRRRICLGITIINLRRFDDRRRFLLGSVDKGDSVFSVNRSPMKEPRRRNRPKPQQNTHYEYCVYSFGCMGDQHFHSPYLQTKS